MNQALSLPIAGLMSDPGPFTAAPEGGLLEAQNVVALRRGVVEPRPGTIWFKDATLKSDGDNAAALYVDSGVTVWTVNTFPWSIRRNGSSTITGPTSFIAGKIRFVPTGGRALFTSENGVCTLPDQPASPAFGSSTVAYRAGMPQPYAPTLTLDAAPAGMPATANWLANAAVAYRFTLRRRLDDGTLVEGPPTQRIVVRNAGAGQAVRVGIDIASGSIGRYYAWAPVSLGGTDFGALMEGDELCVYRSAMVTPSSADPLDEMSLRAVVPYNTSTAAFTLPDDIGIQTNWLDAMPDSEWSGAPLYTNGTEQNAGLANYRPQYARDLALYNAMTFYAGAKTAQRCDLRLTRMGDAADWQQTITNQAFVGTLAIGSFNITAVSDIDVRKMAIGQVITFSGTLPGAADGFFAASTRITGITYSPGNNTIVVSNAALAAGVTNLITWDWIETFDGTTTRRLYAFTNTIVSSWALEAAWSEAAGLQLRVSAAQNEETFVADLLLSFEQPDCTNASFTVKSSKPLAWDRDVDSVTGVTSAQQDNDATLRWSKINEPESCPIPYRSVIGDAAYPIRRIIAAKQSLLIFKDDGLFQWYGETPTGYRIDLVDRTITLPSPKDSGGDAPCKWVGRFDDRVFAMTTRGPMMITDTGGLPVGAPILESLRRRFRSGYGNADESTRALMIDTTTRRVGFFYDLDGTGDAGTAGYVLDVETGTWTYWTWPREIVDFGYAGAFTVFAGGYSYGFLSDSRTMLGDASVTVTTMPPTYDAWQSETCTIDAVTGTGPYTVTIAAGSEWTPIAGDLLIRSGVAHEVTEVTSATAFTTATQPTTGSASWREGFECRVVWLARSENNVGTEKTWIDVSFPFELASLLGRVKAYFKGYRNTSAAVEVAMNAPTTNGVTPYVLQPAYKRIGVPRSHASDWALRMGFTIRQAGAWFSTAGLSVLFDYAEPDTVSR